MIYLGVDPGLTGGLVALDADGRLCAWARMPVVRTGKRRAVDAHALYQWMETRWCSRVLTCEEPRVLGVGNGALANFSAGRTLGHVEMMVAALSLPLKLVSPRVWQPAMFTVPSFPALPKDASAKQKNARRLERRAATKAAAQTAALRLWPDLREVAEVKANDGILDAALIAEWGRRQVQR